MSLINNIKMKPKLLGAFLLAGLLPLFVVAWLSINKSERSMEEQAFNQLKTSQDIKKDQIVSFFEEISHDVGLLAQAPAGINLYKDLKAYHDFMNVSSTDPFPVKSAEYTQICSQHETYLKNFMEMYGYYDVFMMCAKHGHVMFSVSKEADLGENLSSGNLRNSGLGKLWSKVVQTRSPALVDFSPYAPSGNKPAAFYGAPLSIDGQVVAVLAIQVSLDEINGIMQDRVGMGETGETFLVGSDKRMRSDSFEDPTGHSVEASFAGTVEKNGIDTRATKEALAGRSGADVISDYNGDEVLTAYGPVDFYGIRWAVIAQIDMAEVDIPIIAIQKTVMWIAIVCAGLVTLFAFYLATSIANPIQSISGLAKSIAQGDLTQRVSINQKDEVGQLSDAFVVMTQALQTKADAADQIAQGNLSTKFEAASDVDILGNAMVNMVHSLQTMNTEVSSLVEAAVDGNLAQRGDTSKFEGDFARIVEGVNETLDAVMGPINEAAEVLERIADRDLTARVMGNYKGDHAKIKASLNRAIENLDDGLGQVGQASEQVSAAAGQISTGSQSLAEGASEQASSLEEISSSLEEMASMTQQNSENSDQAKALSLTARKSADGGTEAMNRMTQTIGKIKTSSDETAKIVGTIDEIAFQTNLLALNAAVEAARAGEAGKGFAVVAEEVRNLAQRSAEAAKTTANLIEESVRNSEDGVKVTQEVGTILNEIAEGSRKVSDIIAEIAAASTEQSQGITQINTAVTQLDKVTQQNAANAEESASAAEELNGQSTEMQGMVGQFKLTSNGAGLVTSTPNKNRGLQGQIHPITSPKRKNKILEKVGHNGNGHLPESQPSDMFPLDDDEEGFEDF